MTCGWLDRLKSHLLVARLVTISFPTVVHCISNLEDLVDLVSLKFCRHVVFVYFRVLKSFLVLPSENVPVRGKGLQTVGTYMPEGVRGQVMPVSSPVPFHLIFEAGQITEPKSFLLG